jgi:hypothetical protein
MSRSAFAGLFSNKWLWGAVLLSLVLQVAVIYVPFLQQAFSTASLSFGDWLRCAAVASSVLWLRELSKIVTRVVQQSVLTIKSKRKETAIKCPGERPNSLRSPKEGCIGSPTICWSERHGKYNACAVKFVA